MAFLALVSHPIRSLCENYMAKAMSSLHLHCMLYQEEEDLRLELHATLGLKEG